MARKADHVQAETPEEGSTAIGFKRCQIKAAHSTTETPAG